MTILNERELMITKGWIGKWTKYLEDLKARPAPADSNDAMLRQALIDQTESQLEYLRREVTEYEAKLKGQTI